MSEDDHIMFEEMPVKFGQMVTEDRKPNKVVQTETHKTYHSLYEELCDKCYPERYMEPYDAKRVSISTRLYSKVLNSENDLKKQNELRHRASEELGISFDGSKLYKYLMNYLDPRLYLNPFLPDKLEFANKYYLVIEAEKDDYIALEKIVIEAQWFIDELEAKRKQEEKSLMNEKQIDMSRYEEEKEWLDGVLTIWEKITGNDIWKKNMENTWQYERS